MRETVEHNNRFYGEELKTESEQLKEWLIVANKEIERLKKREQECIDHYLVQCKYVSEMEAKYITANNIINELEKWLKDKDKNALQDDNYWEVLDKIQELKGVNKE